MLKARLLKIHYSLNYQPKIMKQILQIVENNIKSWEPFQIFLINITLVKMHNIFAMLP